MASTGIHNRGKWKEMRERIPLWHSEDSTILFRLQQGLLTCTHALDQTHPLPVGSYPSHGYGPVKGSGSQGTVARRTSVHWAQAPLPNASFLWRWGFRVEREVLHLCEEVLDLGVWGPSWLWLSLNKAGHLCFLLVLWLEPWVCACHFLLNHAPVQAG